MPDHKYNVGDTAFIVESRRIIREVKIIGFDGGFYTMRFVDGIGGIRLRANRIFGTKEEAENSIPNVPAPQEKKRFRSPWDD